MFTIMLHNCGTFSMKEGRSYQKVLLRKTKNCGAIWKKIISLIIITQRRRAELSSCINKGSPIVQRHPFRPFYTLGNRNLEPRILVRLSTLQSSCLRTISSVRLCLQSCDKRLSLMRLTSIEFKKSVDEGFLLLLAQFNILFHFAASSIAQYSSCSSSSSSSSSSFRPIRQVNGAFWRGRRVKYRDK